MWGLACWGWSPDTGPAPPPQPTAPDGLGRFHPCLRARKQKKNPLGVRTGGEGGVPGLLQLLRPRLLLLLLRLRLLPLLLLLPRTGSKLLLHQALK